MAAAKKKADDTKAVEEKKTSAEEKVEAASAKEGGARVEADAAKSAKEEWDALAEAKEAREEKNKAREEVDAAEAEESADGEEKKVKTAADVLQDTGTAAGGLDPAPEASEEQPERVPQGKEAPHDGPFSSSAVAGSQAKTYNQKSVLYTDGISGVADNDLDRAYGDKIATEQQEQE